MFKSTNGGGNWSAVNADLTAVDVHALVIDPATPAILYAGTYLGGVFKSTNAGGNWSAVNAGLTAAGVKALAIDPSMPATLYAGTSLGGVFKSTNGSGSWNPVNMGLPPTPNPSTMASMFMLWPWRLIRRRRPPSMQGHRAACSRARMAVRTGARPIPACPQSLPMCTPW